jgi:hypothetical protein
MRRRWHPSPFLRRAIALSRAARSFPAGPTGIQIGPSSSSGRGGEFVSFGGSAGLPLLNLRAQKRQMRAHDMRH